MFFKNLEGQLVQWLEQIQQYDFEVVYRKGSLHCNADGLSRHDLVKKIIVIIAINWSLKKER